MIEKVSHSSTSSELFNLDKSILINKRVPSFPCNEDDDIPLIQLLKASSPNLKRKKNNSYVQHTETLISEKTTSESIITNKVKSCSPKLDSKRAKSRPKRDKPTKEPLEGVFQIETKNEVILTENNDLDEANSESIENKWWSSDNMETENSYHWETLVHNGVYFPPPYTQHHIKMKYKGEDIELPAEAEEIATYFAGIIGSDYEKNPIFLKNFFSEFRTSLIGSKYESMIENFEDCDFSPIYLYLQQIKEQKKNRSKEEKLEEKKFNEALVEKYGYCIIDGIREKIGNFRVEPPGLFRGRGQHPKMGFLKKRILPEDVILNLGRDSPIPPAPEGHKWKEVICDPSVTWLATWTDSISGGSKYVFLSMSSKLKGISDIKKYEKARELKLHIAEIRKRVDIELHSSDSVQTQRATAIWLIDRLALRAGNEKGEDEADTVGCCSLRVEHVSFRTEKKTKYGKPIFVVIFDFLGKDSIRYFNEVAVPGIIYEKLKSFASSNKSPQDPLFDTLNIHTLNRYLQSFMPGLSAKVFRTFNASFTFQEELKQTPVDGSVSDKILAYNRANKQVAILCNHQKAISKSHPAAMARILERINTIRIEQKKLKMELKSRGFEDAFSSSEDDELSIFEENFKREVKTEDSTEIKMEYIVHDASQIKTECSDLLCSQEAETNKGLSNMTIEKITKKIDTLQGRISILKNNLKSKDENKQTALGTSKINYIDPRITVAWCKKHDVPLEKLFSKTLREKFIWATTVDKNWTF